MERISGFVERGGQMVISDGSNGQRRSTKPFQGSFVNALVTVYEAGTVTPAVLYEDNLEPATAKANPFTAAADGQWAFYAANGRYDVRFSGGGLPAPFTIGPLEVFDSFELALGDGSNMVGYRQSGTGAVLRMVQSRLRDFISLRDFNDTLGQGDDCTQELRDAAARIASGGTIHIPEGDYPFSDLVALNDKPGVNIVGAGRAATILRLTVTNRDGFHIDNHNRFAHFTFRGAGNTLTGPDNMASTGFNSGTKVGVVIEDLLIEEWPSFAINAGGASTGWWVRYNEIRNCHSVLFPQQCKGMKVFYNEVHHIKYNGMDFGGCSEAHVIGNRVHHAGLAADLGATNDISGIFLASIDGGFPGNGDDYIVAENHVYDCKGPGIDLRSMAGLSASRGKFIANHSFRNYIGISLGGNTPGNMDYHLVQANHCFDNLHYGIAVDGQAVGCTAHFARVQGNFTRNNVEAGIIVGGANATDCQIIANECLDATPIVDHFSGFFETQIYGNKIGAAGAPGTFEYDTMHLRTNRALVSNDGVYTLGPLVSGPSDQASQSGAVRLRADEAGVIRWRNQANTSDDASIGNYHALGIIGSKGDLSLTHQSGFIQGRVSPYENVAIWYNDGSLEMWGSLYYRRNDIPNGATTPDVRYGNYFVTNNTAATSITGFINGRQGQTIFIVAGDGSTTFVHSANLILLGDANYGPVPPLRVMAFFCLDGTRWTEATGRPV